MCQPKASSRLNPYSGISFNARISIIESIGRHKVFFGTDQRIVIPTLDAYASSGIGNISCQKNHFAKIAADYHVMFRQNAVAKTTANF